MKKELIYVTAIAFLAGSLSVNAIGFGSIGNAIGKTAGSGVARSAAKAETRAVPKTQSIKENHKENSSLMPTVGRGAHHLPCSDTRSSDSKSHHSNCN